MGVRGKGSKGLGGFLVSGCEAIGIWGFFCWVLMVMVFGSGEVYSLIKSAIIKLEDANIRQVMQVPKKEEYMVKASQ